MDPRIEERLAAGDWRGGAQVAETLGQLEVAEELYLKLLDYASAGRVAVARGERIAALEHYLQGGHGEAAEALRLEMLASLSEDIPEAVERFARRQRYHAAAELASSVGQLARAAELYERALSHLEAAQHYERIGRYREAGSHYEAHLLAVPGSFEARLGLGRVLQRFDRHRDACEAMQGALAQLCAGRQDEPDTVELRERLAYSLLHLRLRETAAAALGAERRLELEDPASFVASFRERRGGSASGFSERYRIQGELPGPFGEAYAAHDTMAERAVLVQPLQGSQSARAAYLEAQARLSEPAIGGTLGLVEADRESLRYVVFEHPGGATLASLLSGEQTPAPTGPQLGSVARQVLTVLEQAHRRGVLHSALSPWAVFVRPGFSVVLTGFELGQLGSRAETATAAGADNALSYLAPEAAFGREADYRSDFYGLGGILWRAVTGSPPLGRRPGEGPAGLGEVFERLLALQPESRAQSHAEVAQLLGSIDWSRLSLASVPSAGGGASRSVQAEAGRYEELEVLAPRMRRVRDRWLEREVVRIELGRPLELGELDRVRVFAQPSLGALQRVLAVDAEAGRIDLLASGTSHVALDEAGVSLVRGRLDVVLRLRALLRVATTLARLHTEGQPLGGFALSSVRVDLRDGSPTVWLDAGQLVESASGGAAYASDGASLSALEVALLGDAAELRGGLGSGGVASLPEREESIRRVYEEARSSARGGRGRRPGQ